MEPDYRLVERCKNGDRWAYDELITRHRIKAVRIAYCLLGDRELAEKALNQISASRDACGSWGTTQATIFALKALVLGSTTSLRASESRVDVIVNGRKAGTIEMSGDQAEVTQTVDVTRFARSAGNSLELRVNGKAMPSYQVIAKYYIPWTRVAEPVQEPVHIDVNYSSTRLSRDSTTTMSARVVSQQPVKMAIVDIGVPPGFAVMTEDLEALKSKKVIERYELTGRQIILCLRNLDSKKPVMIRCRMRAMYPLAVSSRSSRVYDYYNPEKVKGVARPVILRVD